MSTRHHLSPRTSRPRRHVRTSRHCSGPINGSANALSGGIDHLTRRHQGRATIRTTADYPDNGDKRVPDLEAPWSTAACAMA